MITDTLMKKYLEALSTDPTSLTEIARKTGSSERNALRTLQAMENVGLVIREPLPKKKGSKVRVGWVLK